MKRSEGHAVSGKYWFSSLKSGTSVLAYCNMETNGRLDVANIEVENKDAVVYV